MSITTMEALEAIPEGGVVQVSAAGNSRQRWTHTAGAWVLAGGDITLPSKHFAGALAAGVVQDGSVPQVGDWLAYGRVDYYVAARAEEDREQPFRVASFQRGRFSRIEHVAENWLQTMSQYRAAPGNVTDPVGVVPLVEAVIVHEEQARQEQVARRAAEANVRTVEVTRIPEAFVDRLREYAREASDPDLYRIMSDYGGISIPTQVSCTIEVTGTSTFGVDDDEVRRYIGASDDVSIDSTNGTVEWSFEFTRELEGDNPDDCVCGQVDSEFIRRSGLLPDRHDGFDFTANCDNC